VIFRLKLALVGAILGSILGAGEAWAQALHVFLTRPPAAGDEAMRRISAELERDGYVTSWTRDASPCRNAAPPAPPKLPSAWVSIEVEAGSGRLVATICFLGSGPPPALASVAAHVADQRQLAIGTLEALNGFLAAPISAPARPVILRAVASVPPPDPAFAGGFVRAGIVFDVLGGLPMSGAGVAFNASLHRELSLELETFAPLMGSMERGEQRELSLHVAWARFGPRLSSALGPFGLGVSLQSGAALLWAKARTTPPLIGSVDLTPAAIVSAGTWLEYPSASTLYFHVGGHVSRLLPSIELELGGGATQPFGQFLIDGGIGLGVRWDRAR
jgi:hypothetical protein